jgi:hypothetical protein
MIKNRDVCIYQESVNILNRDNARRKYSKNQGEKRRLKIRLKEREKEIDKERKKERKR